MYVVVVNQGDPGTTTDWSVFGPYTSEASADDVMNEINGAALDGRISIDRVMVVPFESGIAHHPDLITKLLELRAAGEKI